MNEKEKDLDIVRYVRMLITKDVRYHLTIAHLARETGVNEYKLKRIFKEEYGVGLYRYLMQARMEKARELLKDTDKAIKEIAILCGYKNIPSFHTAFKAIVGNTPALWRKEEKEVKGSKEEKVSEA